MNWFNSGKTFARHMVSTTHFRFSGASINTEAQLIEAARLGLPSPQESIGALGPQAKASSVLVFDHKLSAAEKSDIGRSYIYVWGELSYFDVFRRRHSTIFCSYRYGTVGDFLQCPFHNDAD